MALKITDEQNYQDIADAIRSKLGSSNTFLPSEMADAIESIPAGGSTELKTIFIDYDGTVLYEYTQTEVDALTALPTLPSHEGLICQGWNWTLAELQAYEKPAVVGANYITDDGKTRVYVTIPENDKYVKTTLGSSSAFTATVDWGDGTSSNVEKYYSSADHTYAEAGEYVISFDVHSGTMVFVGNSSIGSKIIYSNQANSIGSIGAINYIHRIELGSNVKADEYAFAEMAKLESISIPENFNCPESMFRRSRGINAIVFPRSCVQTAFNTLLQCIKIKRVSIPATTTIIGENFVSGCICLERICLPDGLVEIKPRAFSECYSLVGIVFPDSLSIIGDYAFNYVAGLPKRLVLSENIEKIGRNCFTYTNIEELEINSEFTSGQYMFAYNNNLKKAEIKATISSSAKYMFYDCKRLEEIYFSDGNTVVPQYMSHGNDVLKKIVLPDSITSIGYEAFFACYSLTEISMPVDLVEIEGFAFSACNQIESLVIPQGVTTITTYCFQASASLTRIAFLGDIQKIENHAFYESGGITEVDLTHCTAVPILESTNAFVTSANRVKIKVPGELYEEWIAADKWSSIASYIVSA